MICNMSSYELSDKEYTALTFRLDHHIPSKTDPNLTYTEFETSVKVLYTNLLTYQRPKYQISKQS